MKKPDRKENTQHFAAEFNINFFRISNNQVRFAAYRFSPRQFSVTNKIGGRTYNRRIYLLLRIKLPI